jgi:hypothetical protein
MGGTGLGLSIVKHVAEAQAGRVSVDSTPGQGSEFRIHLARDAGTEQPPQPSTVTADDTLAGQPAPQPGSAG